MNSTLPIRLVVPVLVLGALVGCSTSATSTTARDRGAGGSLFTKALEVPAPEVDRCEQYRNSTRDQFCQDAKFLAESWARNLSTGDPVCMEGGVAEEVSSACAARASVVDVGTNRVLIEIRSARPDSKYANDVQKQAWYEEGALVDLYLQEQGW